MKAPAIGLAQLTLRHLDPPSLIEVAAECGYDAVSLRLSPAGPDDRPWPLVDDPRLMRETRARLADTGVSVLDVEVILFTETTDPTQFVPVMEVAAEIDARYLLVNSRDPDGARFADGFARLCELAGPYDLRPAAEFIPYTALRTIQEARRVAAGTAGGVVVDALHLMRSGGAVDEVRALSGDELPYLQLSDGPLAAPAGGLVQESRHDRGAPGTGQWPLAELLRAAGEVDALSVEAPSDAMLSRLGDRGWAQRLRNGMASLIAEPVSSTSETTVSERGRGGDG